MKPHIRHKFNAGLIAFGFALIAYRIIRFLIMVAYYAVSTRSASASQLSMWIAHNIGSLAWWIAIGVAVILFRWVLLVLINRHLHWTITVAVYMVALVPLRWFALRSVAYQYQTNDYATIDFAGIQTLDFEIYAGLTNETNQLVLRNAGIFEAKPLRRPNGRFDVKLYLNRHGIVALSEALQAHSADELTLFANGHRIDDARVKIFQDESVLIIDLDGSLQDAVNLAHGILRKNYGL